MDCERIGTVGTEGRIAIEMITTEAKLAVGTYGASSRSDGMTAAIATVGMIAIEDAAGVEIGQMSAVEAEKRQMREGGVKEGTVRCI